MEKIKNVIKKFPLLITIVISSLLLTIAAAAGRETLYKEYSFRAQDEPVLVLVMQGIHDGIYPWEVLGTMGGEGSDAASTGATASAAGGNTEHAAKTEPDKESRSEQARSKDPYSFAAGISDQLPKGVCNPVMQAEDYDVVNDAFLSDSDVTYNTDTEGIFAQNGRYYKLREVGSSYFDDALFIGDSRTVGLYEYGSLGEHASFLAKESVSVYTVMGADLKFRTPEEGEDTGTVEGVLTEHSYGKIYLSLGVNELGIGTTKAYYDKYREIVETIRALQPEAIIYVQGIMHVSYKYSSSDSARNNTVVVQRNEAISTLANGHDIFYIDLNPYVCEANGDLIADLSWDGIHLKGASYEYWDQSLKENAIVRSAKDDIAPDAKEEETTVENDGAE